MRRTLFSLHSLVLSSSNDIWIRTDGTLFYRWPLITYSDAETIPEELIRFQIEL